MKEKIKRQFLLFLAIVPIAAVSFAAKTALAKNLVPVSDIPDPEIVRINDFNGGATSGWR